jgi:hypothetical protein
MEDLDERNGMKSEDQNEETKEEKEVTEDCKERGQPSEERFGERKPIEEFKYDGDTTKK